MGAVDHWERIYTAKKPDEVSWYQAHLARSLELIGEAAPGLDARIIDVGGGESTLPDDLLARGYTDVTVLDLAQTALDVSRRRLGRDAARVTWIHGDVTRHPFAPHRYDVWHDRAVFHFLTSHLDRAAYIRQVACAVRPGGHVIVATFAPDGPAQCSGLDVVRYDARSLHGEFGASFRLVRHLHEAHRTPVGRTQQFVYCFCRVTSDVAT
jgi:2-polyprenyl-3-methyl-5-hydroxy-6-metoxy-1,4-benzoquinol methylase